MSDQVPDGSVELSPAQIEALYDKWSSCWTPSEVATQLAGVTAPWCVAAGWALDLFRGTPTREHGDIEIAVPAAAFPEVRDQYPGFAFDAVGSGRIWEDAAPDALAATFQTWVRDPVTGDYLLDVMREPHDGDTWICRHDPSIRLPYVEIIEHTPGGIPYLAPELALLFKAKHARPKDQADFDGTVPLLDAARRARLAELIGHAYPGHRWLADLPG